MEVPKSTTTKKSDINRFYGHLAYFQSVWHYIRREHGYIPFYCIKVTSLTLFLLYVAVPIFIRANQWIMPKIVFSNFIHWPPFVNLSNPSDFGLNNTRSFKLHVEEGIDIGAWHVLPRSLTLEREDIPLEQFENHLDSDHTVILYLHGNSGSRGSFHRVQLYKLLSKQDYHVVTIDYRGFGDSSGTPTEDGVVNDAYFAYKWLKDRVGDTRIFLWGHSLGTGITTKLAKRLCDEGDQPAGVVLESPFNTIRDAAVHHPFGKPYRYFPWFESLFVNGLVDFNIHFNSEESITSVTPHILILHAKDDFIVPYHLGQKLYKKATAMRNKNKGDVDFVSFEGHRGLGHKYIYQAPELPDLIREFILKSTKEGQRVRELS